MAGYSAAAESLVKFHIEDRRKDETITRLQGQNDAYKTTIESIVTENSRLRDHVQVLEQQLHDKWVRNEVLTTMFSRIALTISEVEDAFKGMPG